MRNKNISSVSFLEGGYLTRNIVVSDNVKDCVCERRMWL